jgi:hypothetical protein
MNGHFADRAGFVAALAADDPERRLAEEHARSCAACGEALEEGRRLFVLLAEARPLAPPTPELVGRAAAAIERETRIDRRSWSVLRWAAAGAVVSAWILQLAYGKRPAHDVRSVALSVSVLAAALGGVALVRARQRFVAAAIVAVSAVSALFASLMSDVSALAPRSGIECTVCELIAAMLPWLAVTILARRRDVALDRATTMAAAGMGALASQAAQLLTCPVRHANPHLLVFHLGGVLLALALGAFHPLGAQAAAGARR